MSFLFFLIGSILILGGSYFRVFIIWIIGFAFILIGLLSYFRIFAPIKQDSIFYKNAQSHSRKILDSTEAAQLIVTDTMEYFFEKIGKIDMAIQMKIKDTNQIDTHTYKDFLRRSASNFTNEEAAKINQALDEALYACFAYQSAEGKSLPFRFLPTILLLKKKDKHYGKGVWYTRQNAIIISEYDLIHKSISELSHVLIHELSHIYSRYNPAKRTILYQAIGFYKRPSKLLFSKDFKDRILLNPDGLDTDYSIKVKSKENILHVVPLIYTTHHSHQTNRSFFEHLNFGLFPILQDSVKYIPYTPDELKNFWEQIGTNTTYIIHPDEIIADNLVKLVFPQEKNSLSAEGYRILMKIEKAFCD